MNPTFCMFLAVALLLGSSSAEAARHGNGLSNLMLPPPFISTTQPPTNPVSPRPGSPTFDHDAALPSLNNSGSLPFRGCLEKRLPA